MPVEHKKDHDTFFYLKPVKSNTSIEERYKNTLLAFFNSGMFLFDKHINEDPIKLNKKLLDYYSNDNLKSLTKGVFNQVLANHSENFDKQIKPEYLTKATDAKDYHKTLDQLQFFNYIVLKNLRDEFIYNIILAILLHTALNAPEPIYEQVVDKSVEKLKERIELISSDQIIKMTDGITKAKCSALGLDEYDWQTMEDDRVRKTHAANNGKRFSWDNPPVLTGHPGTQANCRCSARIIVPDSMLDILNDN